MSHDQPSSTAPPNTAAWDIRVAIIMVGVLFLAQVLFATVALLVLTMVTGQPVVTAGGELPTVPGVVLGSAAYLFAGATALELARHLALRRGWPSLRAAVALTPYRRWLIGIPIALVVAISIDALALLLGQPIVPPLLRPVFAEPALGIAFGLFTVAVPPVVEEVVFRGVLYASLAARYGPGPGIVLSAVAFGMVHLLTYGIDWWPLFATTLMGLAFGALRAYTGSLWPCIAAHAAANAYASLEGLLLPHLLGYWP